MTINKRVSKAHEPNEPTKNELQDAELARLCVLYPKPLDPQHYYTNKGVLRVVMPCVRTAVYRQVLAMRGGVTAVAVAKSLETTVAEVAPHLKELCAKAHIFIRKGQGALVRVADHSQTFVKYVSYRPADLTTQTQTET